MRSPRGLGSIRWAALGWATSAAVGAVLLFGGLVLGGCGAGNAPAAVQSTASSTAPAEPSSAPSPPMPPIPSGGISLRELGFTNGPAAFSLPRGVSANPSVDQPQQVTLVITSPSPSVVADYLRRTLPVTGFTVDRQQRDAIEFTGFGWAGSFVVTGPVSAVTLQPAR